VQGLEIKINILVILILLCSVSITIAIYFGNMIEFQILLVFFLWQGQNDIFQAGIMEGVFFFQEFV